MSITRTIASLGIASAVAVVCALQTGCVPYAYPNLMSVPALRLDPAPEPIHAFRVEVRGQVADLSGSTDDYTLARIERGPGDRLPAQSDVSLEYGLYVVGVAVNFPIHHGKTLLVRLYRPGFETVELRDGQGAKIEWTPAGDLTARERAIDDLLGEPVYDTFALPHRRIDPERPSATQVTPSLPASMPPGSRSAAHRDALLFAAGEYERLTGLTNLPFEDADRLRQKAAAVRARAAE